MKILVSTILLVCISIGCNPETKEVTCQKLRHQYFIQCLEKIPKGPISVHNNDWGDVVSKCGSQAYYQAIIPVQDCKKLGDIREEVK
jgi:hypothetical protein